MFQKRTENFVCAGCGVAVQGDGYTNHCPECFVSKHVDVDPGDRAATCGGLMFPKKIFFLHGQWKVMQRCQLCGKEKTNKVQKIDNMIYLAKLAAQLNRHQL